MTPSRRESEVLTLCEEGLSAPEIGQRLNISKGTVKVHITNLRRKGLTVRTLGRRNVRKSEVDRLENVLKAAQDTLEALAVLIQHQVACIEEFKRVQEGNTKLSSGASRIQA